MTNPEQQLPARVYARQDHYYGGDLYLDMPKDEFDEEATIVWRAWGRHGRTEIRLDDAGEMHRLGEALIAAAKLADPEGYYLEQ